MKNSKFESTQPKQLKKYNEAIKVEVEVDVIADDLLSKMDKEFPHAHMLVDTIMGHAMMDGSKTMLKQIWTNLAGYTNEIDFTVGQDVTCSSTVYKYYKVDGEEGDMPKYDSKYEEIGACYIKEIDVYRVDKVKVVYHATNSKGITEEQTKWVSHRNLKEV